VFALGTFGVNKTQTIQAAVTRISGATFYEQLIPQLRSSSQMFVESTSIQEETLPNGGKSISVQEMLGLALNAHVFYGDEFFKKPDHPALNDLIDYALNGVVRHGGKKIETPLRLFVASGNETPDSSGEIGAVWARMTLRVYVHSLNETQRRQLLQSRTLKQRGQSASPTVALTLEDVDMLQQAFSFVELPDAIVDTVFEVYAELDKRTDQDFKLILGDDRRFARISDILRAHALLNGRTKVTQHDLVVLKWMLWDKQEHIPALMEVLAPYIRTPFTEAQEMVDTLLAPDSSLMKALAGDINQATAAIRDSKDALAKLDQLKAEAGSDQSMVAAIEALRQTVGAEQEKLINKLKGN
jgi:MoxR-like ATPase